MTAVRTIYLLSVGRRWAVKLDDRLETTHEAEAEAVDSAAVLAARLRAEGQAAIVLQQTTPSNWRGLDL